mgnify:FL=1
MCALWWWCGDIAAFSLSYDRYEFNFNAISLNPGIRYAEEIARDKSFYQSQELQHAQHIDRQWEEQDVGEFFDEMERIEEQYDDRRRSFARFLGLPEEEAVQYRKPKDEAPREGLADLDERQQVTKVREIFISISTK